MITVETKTSYFSDLTGCDYDTMAEACKAEFRELLAQRMVAETLIGNGECHDAAAFFAEAYPELWMPKEPE